jgi:hypothetical protein
MREIITYPNPLRRKTMGMTTPLASGTKIRLATWVTPPSSRMDTSRGVRFDGTLAVFPRIIRT